VLKFPFNLQNVIFSSDAESIYLHPKRAEQSHNQQTYRIKCRRQKYFPSYKTSEPRSTLWSTFRRVHPEMHYYCGYLDPLASPHRQMFTQLRPKVPQTAQNPPSGSSNSSLNYFLIFPLHLENAPI
jgi:hypothetical protein